MKQRKWKIVLAVFSVALLSGLCIWYIAMNQGRVSRQFTMQLYGEDGEVTEAEFDLAWQKHPFAPTELRGSVTLNGLIYVCLKDTDMEVHWYHGLEGLWAKISSDLHGFKDLPYFILPLEETGEWKEWGYLVFDYISGDFQSIQLNVPVPREMSKNGTGRKTYWSGDLMEKKRNYSKD